MNATYHDPATATLEEARHVVEQIRKSMRYASGEDYADLSYELADWERVVREREEEDAAAIEEDRRLEQYRDDEIAARHTGDQG